MKVIVNNGALAALLGVKPGGEINVKCKNGIPVIKEWRNRFKDAAIDNCISIKPKPAPANKSKALATDKGA